MTKKRSTRFKRNKANLFIFVVCPILSALSLGLFYKDINSFSLRNNEKAVATIYFRRNTVQRKFIDDDLWERLNNKSPVFNGDKIRTADNSEAFAVFKDSDSKIQIKENSLIQILHNSNGKSIDFLSGEIWLLGGTKKGAVTVVGKKKISAAPNSRVKITVTNSEPTGAGNEPEPQDVVVEVLEGEAKVEGIEQLTKGQALYKKLVEEPGEKIQEKVQGTVFEGMFAAAAEAASQSFYAKFYKAAYKTARDAAYLAQGKTLEEIHAEDEKKSEEKEKIKSSNEVLKAGDRAVAVVAAPEAVVAKRTIESYKRELALEEQKAAQARAEREAKIEAEREAALKEAAEREAAEKAALAKAAAKERAKQEAARKLAAKKKAAALAKKRAAEKAEAERLAKLQAEQAALAAAQSAEAEDDEEEDDENESAAPVEVIDIAAQEEAVVVPQKPGTVTFSKNVTNEATGEFDYQYEVPLKKLFGKNKSIPAGSVIELSMAGVPQKPGYEFYAVFTNGAAKKEANALTPLVANDGQGFVAGERFDDTFRILLKEPIQNTKKSHLAIRFDSKSYDTPPVIDDFELSGKVAALDQNELLTSMESDNESYFHLNRVDLKKVPFNKKQRGFQLRVPLSKIFGESKKIPKGSKLRFVVQTEGPAFHYAYWRIYNCELDEWKLILGRSFTLVWTTNIWNEYGTVTLKDDIENTDSSVFEIKFLTSDQVETTFLKNLKIRVMLLK